MLLYAIDKGRHFLVEMQKSRIPYIKDRIVYYSTFPISKQAPKGDQLPMVAEAADIPYGKKASVKAKPWNFRLDAVYCVAVLGYALDGSKAAVTRSSIRNDYAPYEVFYPKLKYITIELPLFDETLPEYSLDIHLNKWLYFLNYLPSFDNIPEIFKGDPVLEKAFALAEYFNMTRDERYQYERSLKRSWDAYAILEGAVEEATEKGLQKGIEKGIEKGKIEVAHTLLQKGSDLAFIAEVTGLPMDNIRGLQKT